MHGCFRDDVRSSNFDVPEYASAATRRHIDYFDVPKYDSGSVPKYVDHVNHIAAMCVGSNLPWGLGHKAGPTC